MTITMTHPGHDNPAMGRKAAMAAAVAVLTVTAYFGVQAITVTEATHTVRPAAALADADFGTALQSSVIPRSDFGSDLDWIIANDFGSVATGGSAAATNTYSNEIEYLNNSNGAPTVVGCQLAEVMC
jgi:hypothetical protein